MLKTILLLAYPAIHPRLFETGEGALQAAGTPDILIADTYLAGLLTGPEAVESLRNRNPHLAVVFSSGMGMPPGVRLGPRDRILPKPFSVGALLKEVSVMIGQIPRLQLPPLPDCLSRQPAHHDSKPRFRQASRE
jgi:DNA-binding NarL/FixJ family response regulator